MGLIKAIGDVVGGGINALSGAFNSSVWNEYFESGDMSGGILMKRGDKILTGKSKNKLADNNLISSGSGIDVQENQCMIIVENGKIVEFCAEPGRYTFDTSLAPSLFCGENNGLKAFGKEILNQWKTGGQRFTTERVYFINLGEIIQNPILWGSGNISFQHVETDLNDNPIWKIATTLQGNGQFTISVSDPVKFFKEIGAQKTGADGDGIISIQDIQSNLKACVIGKIRQAIGSLSSMKIPYTDIANHESDIVDNLNELLDKEWTGMRGIEVRDFSIIMIDADETAKKKINEFQETVGYASSPSMANVNVQRTMAQGVKAAGENGGSSGMMGIGMGIGMVGNTGLGNMNFASKNNDQNSTNKTVDDSDTWKCECGTKNNGNFCVSCGKPKPTLWTCECGTQNTGNFCSNCGKPKKIIHKYKCSKCGWMPEDPTNPSKFCPNCGKLIGDDDIIQ